MTTARLKIRPALPLCWEDIHTLRLGFDRAIARVERPSAGVQRLVSALRTGVRRTDLASTAFALGVSANDLDETLDALSPALIEIRDVPGSTGEDRPFALAIEHRGRSPRELQSMLAMTGCEIVTPGDPRGRAPDLTLVVERFIEPLESVARLSAPASRRLRIRFTDHSLVVGPLAETSRGPCLDCVSLADVDRDPALPALAAQLVDAAPAAETGPVSEAAAVIAVAIARRWRAGATDVHRSRLRFPVLRGVLSGLPQREPVAPHGSCGCAWGAGSHTESA